jgi:hypothetical protein
MQKSIRRIFYVLIAFAISCPPAFAGVPNLIDFQGSLVDNDGVPVTGTPTIQFALYSANTGGAAIWSETKQVVLQDGVYSTQLGDLTALTDDIWENAQLWLGIKVDADEEMTPRVRIVAVPYAIRAKTAEVAEEVADAARRGAMFSALFSVSGGTSYASIAYSHQGTNQGWTASDNSFAKTLIPRDGEISNLFIRPAEFLGEGYLSYELPADANVTFTIRVNDADTALSVTHVAAVNGLTPVGNTTDRVTVNQGDMVTLKAEGNASTRYWLNLEIK